MLTKAFANTNRMGAASLNMEMFKKNSEMNFYFFIFLCFQLFLDFSNATQAFATLLVPMALGYT
jgi:hypothetical protein